jgi:hypothetical protein
MILAIGMILVVISLFSLGVFVAYQIMPWSFESIGKEAHPQLSSLEEPSRLHFPIASMTPGLESSATSEPVATVSMPGMFTFPDQTPTPVSTGTPFPIIETPPANGLPTPSSCPSVTGIPVLNGYHVRMGSLPLPLVAGCPAIIYIEASNKPNSQVRFELVFGITYQSQCTVTRTSLSTDENGKVSISFIVPGKACFQGVIMATGTILIGSDTSVPVALTVISP